MREKYLNNKFLWFGYFIACAIIAFISYSIEESIETSKRLQQQVEFTKSQDILREKMESFVHGLQGIGGLYLTADFQLTSEQLATYSRFRNNFDNFPGALGFGFIRRVARSERVRYETLRARTSPGFKVKSLGDESHPEHFVIEAVKPQSLNASAVGIDVASEKIRREAALRALETASPALTGPVQLVQSSSIEPGFLLFLPLYRTKLPPRELQERRRELVGFAYAPILLSPLTTYLETHSTERLNFRLYDVTDGIEQKLFQTRNFVEPVGKSSVSLIIDSFDVAGRRWRMEALKVEDSFFMASIFMAVFAGIVMWLILSISLWFLLRQQRRRQRQEIHFAKIRSLQTAILDASTYSIISTDAQGVITTFNFAAERLLGYTAQEMVGKRTTAIIHREAEVFAYAQELSTQFTTHVEPGFDAFVYRARLEGNDTQEWTYVRKDQSTFPVRLTTTVLKDSEQEIIGYLGVAEDLTREKNLQETVERQRAQILSSAKMSALGEMAAGVSHEINNPLAIISGIASVMEFELEGDGKLEGEFARTQLTKIQKTIDRIGKIVQGLRTFARESASENSKSFELSHMIQETLTFCQERFRIHGVVLTLDVAEGLTVHGHLTQLSQVLLNLLNNSYDAIQELPEKWISVRAWREGGVVYLSVTDSGPGIPPDIASRMMEPFFTSKEVGKGTGLGLSISLGIIRSHGGSLEYNDRARNTQFIIQLPGRA